MGDNEPHTNGVNGGGESDDEVNIFRTLWCLVVLYGTLWCFVVMIMKMTMSVMANMGSTGAGRVMTRWIYMAAMVSLMCLIKCCSSFLLIF